MRNSAPRALHSAYTACDVGDPDVEEAAGPIRVWRDLEGDGRLVVGRAAAAIDDDPAVGQRDVGGLAGRDGLAAEHLGVEATRTFDVVGHDEVGENDPLRGGGKRGCRGHWRSFWRGVWWRRTSILLHWRDQTERRCAIE